MNTEELSESTGIMPLDDPEEVKKYEIIDWNGQEARFYQSTGAIFVYDDSKNRWIIRANRGGRPDWDGAKMVEARELKKEKAIIDGLEATGWELDLRTATSVLSAIVAARAKNAIEDEGRTGNADAKFIFSLIGVGEGKEEGPALRIDMDKDTAKELVERLIEIDG